MIISFLLTVFPSDFVNRTHAMCDTARGRGGRGGRDEEAVTRKL
jgi:hypothetical protein